MKGNHKYHCLALFIMLLVAEYSYATNMKEVYLNDLKKVSKIQKMGDNKLFTLIRNTSVELSRDWDEKLATELFRVFNNLLNVNQNYFLVELLEPLRSSKNPKYLIALEKGLSEDNYKLYQKLLKMSRKEDLEGNG